MKRTNQFNARPRSAKEREVFVRWLDASASLWNETNYARRQAFLDDESVCEEYGISVEDKSEAWTSQTCPACGEREDTVRHEDTLTCSCGFEGHADLVLGIVLETAEQRSQADGTARVPQVEQSRLAGTPQPALNRGDNGQRGVHKPEYRIARECRSRGLRRLRPPREEPHDFSRGRMSGYGEIVTIPRIVGSDLREFLP